MIIYSGNIENKRHNKVRKIFFLDIIKDIFFFILKLFSTFSVGNNTTVISVRGSGASRDNTEAEKSNGAVSSREGRDFKERTSSFATDSDVENPVS